DPNDLEIGMFGALWSEHCAYKTSKALLRQLPTEGPHVLQGPGENAGAVDIGDGLAVVFKIESHNHPSAIEPYQGAATGVGGILRDVFAMGARPTVPVTWSSSSVPTPGVMGFPAPPLPRLRWTSDRRSAVPPSRLATHFWRNCSAKRACSSTSWMASRPSRTWARPA